MTFSEQLKALGSEFIEVMESEKEAVYPEIYNNLTKAYNVEEDIAKMHLDDDTPVLSFLKKFYSFGFYAGVKFMLDPDDLHKETIEKIYNK